MNKQAQFNTSKRDSIKINAIAKKAVQVAKKHGVDYDLMTAHMDITACHCNGMPLDLDKLLTADEFNFCHDVFGIRRHINRTSGEIGGCFVPRCHLHDH